jgi:cardiolipin synthase
MRFRPCSFLPAMFWQASVLWNPLSWCGTEQALLQVIGSATKTLFLTSFVAYDVKSIVSELNVAASRDVSVAMILEASSEHGGSISIDVIGKMRDLVPSARLYGWNDKQGEFSGGRVHAKVAVADSSVCFITSANLTGYAMERNMEAGVLITGGEIPRQLSSHLESLIDLRVVEPV